MLPILKYRGKLMLTVRIFIIGHKSPDLDAVVSPVVYTEFLEKVERYPDDELIPVIPEDVNPETEYIFKKFETQVPKKISEYEISEEDHFILVDHNEFRQQSDFVNYDNVLEIVDHHKVNLNFTKPVRLDVRPLGSTASIVFEQFVTFNFKPTKNAQLLILAAILSDTVGLKSSTTTGLDSEIAHLIAHRFDVDLEKLTLDIFRQKSDIEGLSAKEIATKDFKVFDFGEHKIFVSQIETVEPEKILENVVDYVRVLGEIKVEQSATHGFIVVTDILKVNSHVIYDTEAEGKIMEDAFVTVGKGNIADIGPRMSRKKDIVPEIQRVLGE